MADKKLIDIDGLTRYHENIIEVINSKAEEDHNHDDTYVKEGDVERMISDAITTVLNTSI